MNTIKKNAATMLALTAIAFSVNAHASTKPAPSDKTEAVHATNENVAPFTSEMATEVQLSKTTANRPVNGASITYVDPDAPRQPYHLEGHVKRLQNAPWVQEQIGKNPDSRNYLNKPSWEDYQHWEHKKSSKKR